MASAKQKKRPITKKEKDLAWKALRDREAIVKQLDTANWNENRLDMWNV